MLQINVWYAIPACCYMMEGYCLERGARNAVEQSIFTRDYNLADIFVMNNSQNSNISLGKYVRSW